jgi:hypothetical protein
VQLRKQREPRVALGVVLEPVQQSLGREVRRAHG